LTNEDYRTGLTRIARLAEVLARLPQASAKDVRLLNAARINSAVSCLQSVARTVAAAVEDLDEDPVKQAEYRRVVESELRELARS
jgi:hypothetical protein